MQSYSVYAVIPSTSTVRKNVTKYASRANFRLDCDLFATNSNRYSLFDTVADYYTHRNVDMDTVVRVIVDELYAIQRRKIVTS